MKYSTFYLNLLTLLIALVVQADVLTIEDFDSYEDTSSMQANVTTFGSAEQLGAPTLIAGTGTDSSNAAYLMLTWEHGSNANLSLTNLNAAARKLSAGSSIQTSIFLRTAANHSASVDSTTVKLAIEGANDTIWQTKPQFAVQPKLGEFNKIAFTLSANEMETVSDGNGTFAETIADVRSIRFRFENSVQAGVVQDAFIDSIVSVSSPASEPSIGTIIQLGIVNLSDF